MNKKLPHIILMTVLVLLSVGTAFGLRAWLHPPLKNAELLPEPKSLQGQNYRLDIDDHTVPLNIAIGHWVLLYFSYTTCSLSQEELQELGQMMKQFDGTDSEYKPIVIFVSLDPEQDKQGKLDIFTQRFHPDLNDELARLTNLFGVAYNRTTTDRDDKCLINHSSRIFILDSQLRYIGSFAPPYNANTLYSDMQQIILHAWRFHIQTTN